MYCVKRLRIAFIASLQFASDDDSLIMSHISMLSDQSSASRLGSVACSEIPDKIWIFIHINRILTKKIL